MSRAPAARPEPPVSQTADAADFYDNPGQIFGANMKPVTFGQRREPVVDRNQVGPGAYDARPDVTKERLKGGKIDQAPRSPERKPSDSDNVAPGAYEP